MQIHEDNRVEPEDERTTAELRRLNAESIELEAEARRFRHSTIIDGCKLGLAVFCSVRGRATICRESGLAIGGNVFERHEIMPSGRKEDRDWWFATKLGAVVIGAMVAAYVVHVTLLS